MSNELVPVDPNNKAARAARVMRPKLKRQLPTDRAAFQKQLDILRAAAVASGHQRNTVSNEDIARVANLHAGTVSNCNPFFIEAGLVLRSKGQNVPSEAVFAYQDRFQWDKEKAAHKLAPVLSKTWFAEALVPKLTFRPLSLEEAVSFLAEESGAAPEYKPQLIMLVEYLKAAGIVAMDGTNITVVKSNATDNKEEDGAPKNVMGYGMGYGQNYGNNYGGASVGGGPEESDDVSNDTLTFEVPIPGKRSAKVIVPNDLDGEDWGMLQQMLTVYINRWKGFKPKSNESDLA